MTLREIIRDIGQVSDDLVIFATRNADWEIDGPADFIMDTDLDEIGTDLEGLTYFLEVETAKQVLNVWSKWRDEREPEEHERIEALVYYANNDAYIE